MDDEERKAAIRIRIKEQIELVAETICADKEPSAQLRVLRALASELAREESRQGPRLVGVIQRGDPD